MDKVNQRVGLLGYMKKAISELNSKSLENDNDEIQSFEDIKSNSELYDDAQKILKVQEQLRKKLTNKDSKITTIIPENNKSYKIMTINMAKNNDEKIR